MVINRGDEDLTALIQTTPDPNKQPVADQAKDVLQEKERNAEAEIDDGIEMEKFNYSDTIPFGSNGAELIFDADVYVPKTRDWPVSGMKIINWTIDDIKRICTAFSKDGSVYVGMYEPVQADYAALLEAAEKSQRIEALNVEMKKNGFGTVQELLRDYYSEAPTESKLTEIPWKEYKNRLERGMQVCLFGDEIGEYLNGTLFASGKRFLLMPNMHDIITEDIVRQGEFIDSIPGRELNHPSISKEDACRKAEAILEKLDVKDMMLSETETQKAERTHSFLYEVEAEGWMLVYRKQSNGIPCICYKYDEAMQNDQEYAAAMMQEKIAVYVDRDGIWYFDWQAPSAFTEKLSESVSMMDIHDVLDIIKRRIFVENQWLDSERILNKIVVRDIALGYCAIPEKNKENKAFTVPVWIVNYEVYDKTNTGSVYASFAINAINGSNVHMNPNIF